jgi:hypothetical protein
MAKLYIKKIAILFTHINQILPENLALFDMPKENVKNNYHILIPI